MGAAAQNPAAIDSLNGGDLEALRAEVAGGDPKAACRLGQRLLIGLDAPFSPQEGLALVRRAADAGDADALCQLATLSAGGAWMPQDWEAAFELLVAAAERGQVRAQGQLQLLAGERALAERVRERGAEAGDWRRLRQSIDWPYWNSASARIPVCEAPRIRLAEGFVAPEICRWLMQCGRGKFRPAQMFDGKRPRFSADRTNSDFAFDVVEADLVIYLVRNRVSALVRLPVFAMEPPQIFHYAQGQEIKAHYDHVRAQGGYEAERIATFLLYLNDDYEGGELEFPKVGYRYRGRSGDAIFFANVDAAGQPEPLSLHAALPVTAGEKLILSQWIQDRTFSSAVAA